MGADTAIGSRGRSAGPVPVSRAAEGHAGGRAARAIAERHENGFDLGAVRYFGVCIDADGGGLAVAAADADNATDNIQPCGGGKGPEQHAADNDTGHKTFQLHGYALPLLYQSMKC